MFDAQTNQKIAEGDAQTNCCAQEANPVCGKIQYQPPTLREEAEKNLHHHYQQAENSSRALSFFRENPAFDEFVRLVRSGVIRF